MFQGSKFKVIDMSYENDVLVEATLNNVENKYKIYPYSDNPGRFSCQRKWGSSSTDKDLENMEQVKMFFKQLLMANSF